MNLASTERLFIFSSSIFMLHLLVNWMNDIDCIKPSKVETINKPWIYNLDDKDRILAYTSYKIDNPSK